MASDTNSLRYLIDSYRDWMAREGIPIVEGIAVDLNGVETAPWRRLGTGVRGAFVELRGRGDFVAKHRQSAPRVAMSAVESARAPEFRRTANGTSCPTATTPVSSMTVATSTSARLKPACSLF